MEEENSFPNEHDTTPTDNLFTFNQNSQKFGVLSPQQFHKLQQILVTPVSIGGSDLQSPILTIKPFELIQKIKRILRKKGMPVRAVKMNGSTAGFILQDTTPVMKKCENAKIYEEYVYSPSDSHNILQESIFPDETADNSDSNSDSSTTPCSYLSESETDFASGTDTGSVNSDTENIAQKLSDIIIEDNNNNNNTTTPPQTMREFTPTDLDIIFEVDFNSHTDYHNVKDSVLQALYEFHPHRQNGMLSYTSLEAAYIPRKKIICPTEYNIDKWSFLSLHNSEGKNIDLKFISKIKRPYEFSVDSFHIYLDMPCDFLSDDYTPPSSDSDIESQHSIPYGLQVTVETKYLNLQEALYHLNNKIIETHKPEEIRGGGLLKYCYLLIHGFGTASIERQRSLERYMCSRFFIDFNIRSLDYEQKVLSYLAVHFPGAAYPQTADAYMEVVRVIGFLRTLQDVARRSAICLGKEDLHLALAIIDIIIGRYTQPQVMTYSYVPFFAIPPPQYLPKSNTLTEEKSEKSKVYVEDRKPFISRSHSFVEESKFYKTKHQEEKDSKSETRPTRTNEQKENVFPNTPPQLMYNFLPIFAFPNIRPIFYTPTLSLHKQFMYNTPTQQQQQQQQTFKSSNRTN